MKSEIQGLLFVVLVAFFATLLATMLPGFNSVLVGLIVGMVIGNLLRLPSRFTAGVNRAGSSLLEWAIILLAFDAGFDDLSSLGWQTLMLILLSVTSMLVITSLLSKYVKCPASTGLLVGFGTTICGSSAIAAVAPSVASDKDDIGIAVAVVNLLGAVFMLILPIILVQFDFVSPHIGLILGATLHAVGHVAGAGYGVSEAVGLEAVAVKMIRVALLAPAIFLFSLLNRKSTHSEGKHPFNLPYYLWFFILISALVSWVEVPNLILETADVSAGFLLTMAMAAIGLKTGFKKLYNSGKKAIGFGVLLFTLQTVIVLLLATFFL